jgi:hypothetical protein
MVANIANLNANFVGWLFMSLTVTALREAEQGFVDSRRGGSPNSENVLQAGKGFV